MTSSRTVLHALRLFAMILLILSAPRPSSAQQPRDAEAASFTPPRPQSYGAMLLRMSLGVLAVCAVAFLVLKYGVQRFASPGASDKHFEVLARFPLEPRRSLLIARVASKTLLLASSEAGVHLLRELDAEDAATFGADATARTKPPFTLDAPPVLEAEASEE
ncbi:MAG: flagellar biosynthetic protein FliO [Myxococcota bacterium]